MLSTLAALILAIIAAVLIASYVQGANQRAYAGAATREVLIVGKPIAAGTPVTALPGSLQLKSLPEAAIADGAMSALGNTADLVTAVNLVPGEQLLRSRLVSPASLQGSGTVAVPKGMQEISIQLSPDRMVGGSLTAGDTVGIFISFPASGNKPTMTRLVFQKVLVTAVQGAPAPSNTGKSGTAAAPTGSELITFALSATNAEKIVYSAQYGSIWLSKQPANVDESGTGNVTQSDVFH
nr:Flp pilus assembly protein CpaB [Arthrobacter sp. SDTb3-6]